MSKSHLLTIGVRLVALKERSGLSLSEIAALAGYGGASSIQRLFNARYSPEFLSERAAEKLKKALVGRGDPPIKAADIDGLTAESSQSTRITSLNSYVYHANSKVIPVIIPEFEPGAAADMSGKPLPTFSGAGTPSFTISSPDHIHQPLTGIIVVSGNMIPKYELGDLVIFSKGPFPRSGEHVVVYLKAPTSTAFIAQLVRVDDNSAIFEQLSPPERLQVARAQILRMGRILPTADLLPPMVAIGA